MLAFNKDYDGRVFACKRCITSDELYNIIQKRLDDYNDNIVLPKLNELKKEYSNLRREYEENYHMFEYMITFLSSGIHTVEALKSKISALESGCNYYTLNDEEDDFGIEHYQILEDIKPLTPEDFN